MTGDGTRSPNEAEARARELEAVRSTYGDYRVRGYDRRWDPQNPGTRRNIDERDAWLRTELAAIGAEVILDVGCGSGGIARMLAELGPRPRRFIGVDVLPDRIAAARTAAPWAEFVVTAGDDIPVGDATMDAVLAITLLSSVRDPVMRSNIASEMVRVTRPGGAVIIYDIRFPSPRNRAVRPVSVQELQRLFPGWALTARTLTLLPPLARSQLVSDRRAYRVLSAIPLLRSHLGAVLVKPAGSSDVACGSSAGPSGR